MSLKGIIIVLK